MQERGLSPRWVQRRLACRRRSPPAGPFHYPDPPFGVPASGSSSYSKRLRLLRLKPFRLKLGRETNKYRVRHSGDRAGRRRLRGDSAGSLLQLIGLARLLRPFCITEAHVLRTRSSMLVQGAKACRSPHENPDFVDIAPWEILLARFLAMPNGCTPGAEPSRSYDFGAPRFEARRVELKRADCACLCGCSLARSLARSLPQGPPSLFATPAALARPLPKRETAESQRRGSPRASSMPSGTRRDVAIPWARPG